jgi:hypothetical protein
MIIGDVPKGTVVPLSAPSTMTSCVEVFLALVLAEDLVVYLTLLGLMALHHEVLEDLFAKLKLQ